MNWQDRTRSPLIWLACGLQAGCFSPNVAADGESSTTAEPATSGATTTTPTSGDGPSTGAGDSSDASTTTTDPSTTEDSESASGGETDTSDTSDTTGTSSYCGDGEIDTGEECDDGLDSNGLDQNCLPDCNLNVCGDGNVGPEETCDEGSDDNLLEPGACAPDCSGPIETRRLVASDFSIAQDDGNFGPNPLATADAMCPAGYEALLAVPGQRQVTNSPNQANAVVDWPLHPFTAYVNDDNELVWVTDAAPLLGVREGIPAPLINVIDSGGPFAVTGLNQDWTTNTAENCNNFGSSSPSLDLRYTNLASDDTFLSGSVTTPCNDTFAQVICIEQ